MIGEGNGDNSMGILNEFMKAFYEDDLDNVVDSIVHVICKGIKDRNFLIRQIKNGKLEITVNGARLNQCHEIRDMVKIILDFESKEIDDNFIKRLSEGVGVKLKLTNLDIYNIINWFNVDNIVSMNDNF